MKPSILFFFPTFCDGEKILSLTREARGILKRYADRFKILIIDDGSPDATSAIADEITRTFKEVQVIHHPRQQGYGSALCTGLTAREGFDYVFFTDGDHPVDLEYISLMIPRLADSDGVITCRTNKPYGFYRRLISEGYNLIIHALFHLPFKDINSPLKAFRSEAVSGIELHSSPFAPAELLIKASGKGLKIAEVAIPSKPQQKGRSYAVRPLNILLTIRDMLILWWTMKTLKSAGPS